jgi:hypothetical protein
MSGIFRYIVGPLQQIVGSSQAEMRKMKHVEEYNLSVAFYRTKFAIWSNSKLLVVD